CDDLVVAGDFTRIRSELANGWMDALLYSIYRSANKFFRPGYCWAFYDPTVDCAGALFDGVRRLWWPAYRNVEHDDGYQHHIDRPCVRRYFSIGFSSSWNAGADCPTSC